MKRWLEVLGFMALAAALHLAAFASQPKSGVVAGGRGGENLVSIKAAASSVTEMVSAWESPSVTQTQPQSIQQTPRPPAAPAVPTLKIEHAPQAQMAIALAPPTQDEMLEVDTTPPPPPVAAPKERVKPEPKQLLKTPKQIGRKAKVTSAGVNKQVAAGSGGGSQVGAGSAEVNAGSSGKQAKLKALWGAKIRARIERNQRSHRGTDGGNVAIGLTISRDGHLLAHELLKSSGDLVLDQAALSAVARTKRFPKAPKELQGDRFRFSVPMRFEPH